MKRNKTNRNVIHEFSWYKILVGLILVVYSACLLFIIGWGLMKSMHDFKEWDLYCRASQYTSIPKKWTLDNYLVALNVIGLKVQGRTVGLPEMFFNSLLYSVGCAFVNIMTTAVMAYVTTKHKFRFNKVINFCYFFSLLVPILGAMPSSIRVTTVLGLRNTWIGIFIMKMTFTGGTSYLIMQAAFKSIDDGYREAALIDGASNFRIMVNIIFPLVSTIIITFFLLGFIGYWNDYSTPMIYLQNNPPASYGLFIYSQGQGQAIKYKGTSYSPSSVPVRVAGYMLLIGPIFVLFLIFKSKLLGNLTEGGLKG